MGSGSTVWFLMFSSCLFTMEEESSLSPAPMQMNSSQMTNSSTTSYVCHFFWRSHSHRPSLQLMAQRFSTGAEQGRSVIIKQCDFDQCVLSVICDWQWEEVCPWYTCPRKQKANTDHATEGMCVRENGDEREWKGEEGERVRRSLSKEDVRKFPAAEAFDVKFVSGWWNYAKSMAKQLLSKVKYVSPNQMH